MFNIVKGTHDVILKEASKYTYVENLLSKIAESYDYKEFRTPIMEYSELFLRSTGESSDIVNKETYTFVDKGDRSITLRPELTAGCVRMLLENKLYVNEVNKFYYFGSVFRYERPQTGRYREHTQFGVEVFGVKSPYQDAEVISIVY